MENLEIAHFFKGVYKNRKALITGHTGFKGSWLSLYLKSLGAEVFGYSLSPPSKPSHYELLERPGEEMMANINEIDTLKAVIEKYQPDIVFHLAAQALVRYSYQNPLETYQSNVLGTLSVYEASRHSSSVKAIVSITTDKVYENQEWIWAYRENDALGGYDLYSSSKACCELLSQSYRDSFFNLKDYGSKHQVLLSTARAGNVIGGGDWGQDRLVPDIIKATLKNQATLIRMPKAVRPWQHVLEPLTGYLQLGQKLLEGNPSYSGAWNFGPSPSDFIEVGELTKRLQKYWPSIQINWQAQSPPALHEANQLKLDSSKAQQLLGWTPVWTLEDAIQKTALWYRDYYEKSLLGSSKNLEEYCKEAQTKEMNWTC